MRKVLLVTFLFFVAFGAFAQKAKFEFYTKADGLLSNLTTVITQDDQGFIWFLNEGRLLRFDGRKFLAYPLPADLTENTPYFVGLATYQDSLLITSTQQSVILLNPKNDKWEVFLLPAVNGQAFELEYFTAAGSNKILLSVFNKNNSTERAIWYFRERRFEMAALPAAKTASNTVYRAIADASGNTYLFKPGLLQVFDPAGRQMGEVPVPESFDGIGTVSWADFDPDNNLICLADFRFFKLDRTRRQFSPHRANRFLTSNQVALSRFTMEKNGSFWACGGDRNLVYYDAAFDTLFSFQAELEKLIPHRCNFNEALRDKTGVVWIGTQLGLLKVAPRARSFDTYFAGSGNANTYYSFRGLAEDEKGMVYGSYYIGGVMIDPAKKVEYPNAYPVTMPFGLYAEGDRLWLNTGKLWNTSTKTLTEVPGSIPGVYSQDWGVFTKDKSGRLWWAYYFGLYRLENKADGMRWEKVVQLPGKVNLSADVIHTGQNSGLIWIGFQAQLFAWSPQSENLREFGPKELNLPLTRIMAIKEDREGKLWLGTDIGLVSFNPSTGQVRHYSAKDGLPNDFICGMLPEGDSCLWLSTSHGLSRFLIADGTFANFYKEDGLTDDEFNRASYLKARNGRMFFGGMRGINAFFPQELMKTYRRKNEAARVVLSSVEHTDERRDTVIRQYVFGAHPEIHLYHWDRSFAFEYALTDFTNPGEIQYSYRMEGYEDPWSAPSTFNFTRFSSLPSGDYVFRVKARDSHGLWHPNELAVRVVVHPPWWATWWAYLLYGLGFIVVIYFARRYELNRQALKTNVEIGKVEAEKLKELDHFKSRLYTNLTHEFRTPLTIILGMAQQIRNAPKEYLNEGTRLIETNGKNLLHLINQLLDLSKMESKSFKLNLQQSNIVPYLRYITESFQTFANSKNLSLRFFTTLDSLEMDYDPEQIKQVLTNLISNAVKFTPSGGGVIVRLSGGSPKLPGSKGLENLEIVVKDTGIGISKENLPYIFDRFYQVDGSHTREGEGTGIGLAHTQELVKAMGGAISVESEIGKGSTFLVRLPVTKNAPPSAEATSERFATSHPVAVPEFDLSRPGDDLALSRSSAAPETQMLPQLLIIEDNPDVVVYLKSCLGSLYQLDVAYNGKIGIEKALDNIPDLIISDVMMPEKDGYQVCDTLKNDERTSHIPIILLTAKADAASKIAGLRRGADAYLSKPFDKEELLVTLEMQVERQKRMVAFFSQKMQTDRSQSLPETVAEEAIQVEDAFIQKVRDIVAGNFDDENFGLPQLCQKIGMSRSQLFRKMSALMDTSPSDFIRSYRLNQAKMLLETTDLNVSEVAWKVGYKDMAHFSKSFQDAFGILPSVAGK